MTKAGGMLVVDESFAFAVVTCIACGSGFSCNPNTVPSVIVEGVREPVCQACVRRANVERRKNGLQPFTVMAGAYAPCPLSEL